MTRKPVSSSNLRSVGYDIETQVLEIEFHSGSIYQYFTVPESVYINLLKAASLGRFFHYNIKYIYRYRRVV